METNEIFYTTAESAYDYLYVTVKSDNVGTASNGKVIRKVSIPYSRVDYQVGRYRSGLHMAVDQAEWDKLVGYGLVNIVEERAPQAETD
jgi:hypothetical protein